MPDQVTVKVEGVGKIISNLKKYQFIKREALEIALKEIGFKIEADAKKMVKVDTGRLRASISTAISGYPSPSEADKVNAPSGPKGLVVVVGTNVSYACVVGSRHQVYEPIKKTSRNIGNYPFNTILSKDGNPHKIIAHHKFYRNKISAVSIRIRNGRNPLILTNNHLVLIKRKDKVFWEKAAEIGYDDEVFTKRAHNYISDNSNKTQFICECGKTFYVENYHLKFRKPKYCSLDCRHKYGSHNMNEGKRWSLTEDQKKKHRGKNNAQWRDGSSEKKYSSDFNMGLKNIVKERDEYKCRFCDSLDDLIVHHIDWNKKNNDINNLITLCRKCHGGMNKLDCELPVINHDIFKPIKIIELKHFDITRKGKLNIPFLYDFTIDKENSFMVGGILIHNSYQEYGTYKMSAHPYLFPAYKLRQPELVARVAKVMKQKENL